MKPIRNTFASLAWLMLAVSDVEAATIFEGTLLLTFEGGASLGGGNIYLRVDGDSLDYTVWSNPGSQLDAPLQILGEDGFAATYNLSFDSAISLHGCDLSPRNPYLPLTPEEIAGIGNPVTCDALRMWNRWSGVLIAPDLAEELTSSSPHYAVFGGYRAELQQVPEPSASLLLSVGITIVVATRRKRPNKCMESNG